MKVLIKSFCKWKKKWLQLFLVTFLSTFMLCTLYTYYEADLLIYCGNGIYGSYASIVEGIEEDEIERFCNTEDVVRYQKFYREDAIGKERTYQMNYVTEDFLDFTEYELIQGSFPKANNEILCESWYLYQMGFSKEELIGAKIVIEEKQYTVSGIIKENRLWENGQKEAVCICMQNGMTNAVAFECRYFEDVDKILDKYDVSCGYVNYNINLWVHGEETINTFREYALVAAVVLIAVLLVISNCISLLLLDHRKNIGIYKLVGIPERKIRMAFAGILIGIVLGAGLAGTGGAFLCTEVLFTKLAQMHNIEPAVIEQQFSRFYIILIAIAIFILYAAFIYVYCVCQIHKDSFNMVRNERKYKFKKKKKEGEQSCSITNIAAIHLQLSRFSNIFTMIAICVIFIAFHIEMFSVKMIAEEAVDYKGYDYIADIDSDSSAYIDFANFDAEMDKINEQRREFMNQLLKLDTKYVKSVPVYCYYTNFNIEKEKLSKDYITGLGNGDIELRNAVYDNFTDSMEVPAVLVGVTEEELKEFYKQQNKTYTPLEDGHCITFHQPYNYIESDKNVVDFSGENKKLELENTKGLIIDSTFFKYTGDLILDGVGNMNNVVMVNVSTYEEITGLLMPSLIYFNVEDSYVNEFTKLFEERIYVTLTDTHEEGNQLKLQKMYPTVYIFIVFIMLGFVIVNISSTVYLRTVFFSKEYAVMNAMGVGYHKIASIIRRELSCILIPALITANAVCYIGIRFIYSRYHAEAYYKLGYPYQLQMLSNIGIIVLSFLCIQLVVGKLQKLCPHSLVPPNSYF